jgi:predicted nucleic acid-binding protein
VILLDTSVWIEFLAGRIILPEAETKVMDFVTCPPVVQEVLQGFSDRSSYAIFEDWLLLLRKCRRSEQDQSNETHISPASD